MMVKWENVYQTLLYVIYCLVFLLGRSWSRGINLPSSSFGPYLYLVLAPWLPTASFALEWYYSNLWVMQINLYPLSVSSKLISEDILSLATSSILYSLNMYYKYVGLCILEDLCITPHFFLLCFSRIHESFIISPLGIMNKINLYVYIH